MYFSVYKMLYCERNNSNIIENDRNLISLVLTKNKTKPVDDRF